MGSRSRPKCARKLKLLKVALVTPAPTGSVESKEVTTLLARLEGEYGKGKYTRRNKEGKEETLDLGALSNILVKSRDPREMEEAWAGWHSIAKPMKKDFVRFVELQNKGARQLGFKDTGALWRSKYDMPPDAFAREVDRLWEQTKPLYLSLHAYVRKRLRETYGPSVVPETGPIPAHLLGNMWAQQWGNIEPLVAPKDADPGFDLTARLKEKKIDELEMVRYGERFFTSLGFEPLPKTFWERSLFVKPRDREVVCHASAWDVDNDNDLRIKMCIEINAEDFSTIHHELGHNFYQRAYNQQPFLFRDSANDGFHEAIGDTIALSITPSYLKKIGLIDQEPDPSKDIGLLLRMALDKIAFLPFGLLVDQWRWKVFSGEITPGRLQPGLVGPALEVPGRRPARERAAKTTSMPRRSTTSPRTCPTRATSSPTSSSSSSTARCARPRARPDRSIAARSTAPRRRAPGSRPCWPWACRSRGPTPWRRSPDRGRWTPPRSSTTSHRCRSGSTNRTRASPLAGSRAVRPLRR